MFNMMKIIWLVVEHLPLWKMMEWKSVGIIFIPNVMGKMKAMFQTTNQVRDKNEMQY